MNIEGLLGHYMQIHQYFTTNLVQNVAKQVAELLQEAIQIENIIAVVESI